MKKTITTPIAFFRLRGNYKEAVSKLPQTAIATYEKHINTTYLVVNVEEKDGIDLEVSELYKNRLGIPENDFISRQYSKSGIDFITK